MENNNDNGMIDLLDDVEHIANEGARLSRQAKRYYRSIVCKGLNRKSTILSCLLRLISHLLIFITVTDIIITVTVIRRGCYEG